MVENPFTVLEPFSDRLRTALFTKEDNTPSDEDIAAILGVSGSAGPWQVHGKRTIVVREPMASTEKADGIITDQKGLALCIDSADCQTFVISVPEKNIVGLLHAGWRGLNAGAITEFYNVLQEEFDVQPQQTFVGAAPSLCTTCAEFTNPEEELPNIDQQFLHDRCVDLQGAADAEFQSLGVPAKYIERHPDCTRCHPEKYWTYRGGDREAVEEGQRNVLACTLI